MSTKKIWRFFGKMGWSVLLLILISRQLHAQVDQDGWKLILENNFVAAKNVFEASLNNKPGNKDALVGMIFIAETVQDYNSYKKYIKTLIETANDDHYHELFMHMYEADPNKMLQKDLNETLKCSYRQAMADTLFQQRKMEKSRLMLRNTIGDYNWSMIGPFTNISGSGFIEEFPVEKTPYYYQANFKNEKDMKLHWHNKEIRQPDGMITFSENLPYSTQGVYYANTFLEIPSDRVLQLRIIRSAPLKIWLDDNLVFENNSNVNFKWDSEIVELPISQGEHRLLVKCADYPEWGEAKTISLDYNDQIDKGDGYNEINDYNWGRQHNSNYYNPGGDNSTFGIRLTDKQGYLNKDISSSFTGDYQARTYDQTLYDALLVKHIKTEIDENPDDLKNYYLLSKAFLLYKHYAEGEAYFHQIFEKKKELSFFRYLLARFYASNGKGEKAEELISGQDEKKVPFFALMRSELIKIDQEKDKSQYLASLDKLLGVSPTHWGIISNYLEFYQKNGKSKEKRDFINAFLEKFPDAAYQKRLKPYLENDSYKPSSFQPLTDKKRDKNAKDALKRMKKTFRLNDYYIAISYYKRLEKTREALQLYDDLINFFPYQTNHYKEKAKFLFEKDRLNDALAVLKDALNINAYDKGIYETIGDIYFEKGNKEEALKNYLQVKTLSRYSLYDYGDDAIDNKINKIREKPSLKEYFESVTFEEALADNAWKSQYKEDESVVLFYAVECILDHENTIDYTQKMMIQIQNDAGAKYWTEANFGFLGEISFVKVLKKDGRETSPNRSYGYVVFKNLEPGDIIQIEGNSKANMTRELPGQMFHIAAISHDVPIYKAKMEFIHPKEIMLNYDCYRLDCKPETKMLDDYKLLSWDFKNIPKMEHESAILDDLDTYAWMMFSTQKDWSAIVDWFIRKTYRKLETNYEIESELMNFIEVGMSEEEIVERVYNYVTKEITYSHVGFLNSNYVPKKPSSTISDEIGDCKDVASLMISMLRYVGIEAYYILVRSSNYTNQKPLPAVIAFNHVIVGYVLSDGVIRYVDLTTDYYPHYVIPEFDNNSWALLIKEGENDVFRLPSDMLNPDKSRLEIKINAKINGDRSLEMNAQTIGTGVLGGKLRESLNRVTTLDERKKYLSEYFGEGSFDHLTIEDFSFRDLDRLTAPLRTDLRLKAYNHIEKVSNFFIVQIPLLKAITTKPALFSQKRYNNLDLYSLFETGPTFQEINLEIPPEYQLIEMPLDVKYDNDFGSYELLFKKTENGMHISRDLIMKTRLVEYQDYEKFKLFYFKLLDADRTKLAIVKRRE